MGGIGLSSLGVLAQWRAAIRQASQGRLLAESMPVRMDIRVRASDIGTAADILQEDWCRLHDMGATNEAMKASGEILQSTFEFIDGVAYWEYTFENMTAKKKWSSALARSKSVSLTLRPQVSFMRDQGGEYIYEFNVGISQVNS